jgi:hypothetical protein
MNARVRFLLGTCVLLIGGSIAPAPMPRGYHNTQRSSSICFAGFPQGVFRGSPYQITNVQLAFFLTASYTLKDPSLAHEGLPGIFVDDMTPVTNAVHYSIADGSAGNFAIHLNVFQDATQDHYGMTVVVDGPPSLNFNGYDPSHIQTDVEYFEFTLPAQYVSGAQLIQDAGVKVATYLNSGWTCNQVISPRQK